MSGRAKKPLTLETILAELESLVRGTNYVTFLRAYHVPLSPEAGTAEYVARRLARQRSSAVKRRLQERN